MKRPVGHLTIMLLYLLTVPFLTDLRSVFDHGKAGIAYAKDGGGGGGGNGGGGKGDGGGGRDGSGSGRGDGDGARGSESVGYEGGHGVSRSRDGARAGRPGHDHVGRGIGDPAMGSGQARNLGRDRAGQQGLEPEVQDREAALRVLDVEAHRREAEAEDRDLGIIAAATPR